MMSHPSRVLVLGYGNPARCDDGLGPALAHRLREMAIPGVSVETAYQLNVEDAERVSRHDLVVFVDACLCSPPPFSVRELAPRARTVEFSTHSLAPEGVLGLAHELFGAATRGVAVGIRGYDFHHFREEPTGDGARNLEEATTWLADALRAGGALGAAATAPTGRSGEAGSLGEPVTAGGAGRPVGAATGGTGAGAPGTGPGAGA
jgi:hydrogenase maturation protease